MIHAIIDQQDVECMGGFIATFADAITIHLNPSKLYKYDIGVIIKGDGTIWAKRVAEQNTYQVQNEWIEVSKDAIKPQNSPLFRKVCFFKIGVGNLNGTYIISEDFIKNEHFSDEQSYLEFITN